MKLKLKKHWRIWMLTIFVVLSTVFLFAPPLGDDGGETEGEEPTASAVTNLQFGLELSGGTQVRAPLVGMTVSGLDIDPGEEGDIRQQIQQELDVGAGDVRVDAEEGTVEFFQDEFVGDRTRGEFADAVSAAGFDVAAGDVRLGVTSETRGNAEDVLGQRIDESGLTGGSVSQVAAPGQQFILIEVPGADRQDVIDLIGERGQIETIALFPDGEGGYEQVSLADQSDFATIGSARQADETNPRPRVPITLTESAAQRFADAMIDFGFTQNTGQCAYDLDAQQPEGGNSYCLLTVLDGEVVFAASLGDDLAAGIESGDFVESPNYVTTAQSFDQARQLELNMRAGALPTTLDIENRGTTFFLLPSLAEQFKPLSLLTGAAAIGAVALMVFFRYRKPEVAAPMLVTAGAEVYILLGFAAFVGLPLDLSHIAGFIAVIGTGVDDLVIIADEIMQQGEVRTSRVFESRFKKAFWVIGAAAATTIIAMSPLAVLSLGDLRGFAIVTIVGVLIGVLVTRPAYGDILRILVLEDEQGST
ncbi:MAG: preprotein translocase subunit SecD [Natronomonas sp.]